jgi:hypothetical protein
MAMNPPVSYLVWKLMPEEEKLLRLREDNEKMDQSMKSRHLARYLHSSTPDELSDAGKQISLLTDESFVANHGLILKAVGEKSAGEGITRFYDEVTTLSLRMFNRPEEGRREMYQEIREKISVAAGIPVPGKIAEGGA